MLKLAALTLAAASAAATAATSSPALVANAPWWEKVTVTVSGDGKPQSCRYESSQPNSAQSCEVSGTGTSAQGGGADKDQFTRITFERRFSPARPDSGALQTGDTLLGRQVLALAIDGAGAVRGCDVVASGGDMTPDYGCDQAKSEKFKASAGQSMAATRQAYLTVLVYGHAEHVV